MEKKEKKFVDWLKWTTVFVIVFYIALITWWHLYVPGDNFALQSPGADNRPEGSARSANDVVIGEFFMNYSAETETASASFDGRWTSFRGERSLNIISNNDPINTSADDYPLLWSVTTGEGHAAPVILAGKVYFLDYDEQLSSDALRCFDLATGKELWRRWYRSPIKRNHGFSRTVPAVGDDYIITIGPEGHVMSCDPLTGNLLWTLDMQKQYNTEVPFWYTGQCPNVDNGVLILAPAGEEVLLTGIDCLTGQPLWTTPNTLHFKMSHSSITPMTLSGKLTYVYIGVGGVCGISAEKSDMGRLLWSATKWQPSVVAPSPLQISTDKIFLVAGYGAGGALLQVERAGDKWTASILEQYKPSEGLSSEQQTPIFFNNLIFSVMPKDGGAHREKLVCYSPQNLHQPVRTSAANERFGLGPYIVINSKLFILKDTGELYVYEISGDNFTLLKHQTVIPDGADAWGPMAYADGRLLVRDAHNIKCLKIN
ncbi:MAG: PQQ-like beta-propeller repeat protein [Tannerella sp.]|nr:PQQ-like beta-propeller repeat protein [Tannerella sp.]